ncbi:exonuclease V [Annulohypoxylon maeteangense]|uniref:exonuclease V n=1 Tax=Annulohypoxylon maeteangense TaxID=1927788 RepID=UPI0020084D72|nr:exonuclease V [Annulohypoxylon maeteangense]KAI0888543.1 exonuclease V [Annulohypoxylon maeteangense]
MATSVAPMMGGNGPDESDYGSDFSIGEEVIVNRLLEDIRNKSGSPSESTSSFSSPTQFTLPIDTDAKASGTLSTLLPPPKLENLHFGSGQRNYSTGTLPRKSSASANNRRQYSDESNTRSNTNHSNDANASTPLHIPSDDVLYPDLSHALSIVNPNVAPNIASNIASNVSSNIETPIPETSKRPKDSSSPLKRFRSFPKRPLTVSDLSSGAWCELQYWYTLTRLPGGRKTRTAAMKGGTRVHQTLEDQVHTTVQVSITNKEEAFALRLWNVIQGLRTLRDAGLTRELEVWGIIEGQIVNGIIDEISHESPNPMFEQELSLSQSSRGFVDTTSKEQSAITDYLKPHHKTFYLTDVKTRASERLPTGAALRPARVQLFLYHRLLGEMASGTVDFNVILDRYGLRAEALFSDAFMAQVGDLHDEIFYDADSEFGGAPSTPHSNRSGQGPPSSSQSYQMMPPAELIRYRSIAQMLPLLRSELRETFPRGAATLGELLAVQYRHRDDGRIIGINAFPNDPEALKGYLQRDLQWWRGEREADGVCIEETYKCRSCEFAESCQWRKDKETAILQKSRKVLRASS